MTIKRSGDRAYNQIRFVNLKYDAFGYANSSLLFEIGRTKVLISITLQNSVPPFLRGQKTGWLTAEYSMLPCATHRRTNREANQLHKNSRSVEISRLIGRSLRSVVDLSLLPEKTIIIDCDVLQADGGTRVACITAASLALKVAIKRWINSGVIEKDILKEQIAAISVGVVNGKVLLDLNFYEDNQAQADFNFVLTKSGNLIEVQGTAEKGPLSWENFDKAKALAVEGVKQLFQAGSFNKNEKNNEKVLAEAKDESIVINKPALFSIGNRLDKTL